MQCIFFLIKFPTVGRRFRSHCLKVALISLVQKQLSYSTTQNSSLWDLFFIVGNRKRLQGAKSELYSGCGTISMFFVAKNWRTSFATWGHALLWCSLKLPPGFQVASGGCERRSISWELFCNISHWWFALQAHNGWKSRPFCQKKPAHLF